jgi:chemotaxis protein MotA
VAADPKPKDQAAKNNPARMDFATLGGLALALFGILGGLLLEGGKLGDIAQLTAAIIVLGGTLGAVMVSMPMEVLKRAATRLVSVVRDSAPPLDSVLEEIIRYATKARQNGLVSLEQESETVTDPFLRKALTLAVDGTDLQEIRSMLELEIEMEEALVDAEAKVFEGAGGYAPTIGIIGAVLGLIQVMKNLANIDEVGHGIAVAFVATVYGVGLANLFLLPCAQKIRARAHAETQRKELMIEGVSGIVEGLNPKLIRMKIEAYTRGVEAKTPKSTKPAKASAATVSESAPGAEA